MKALLLLCLISFVGCMKSNGPEEVLKEFVDLRFEKELSKSDLEKYFAGDMLENITGLDEAALGNFSQNVEASKRKYTLDFKRCDEDKCFITYTLSYTTTAEASQKTSDVGVKVKKIAELRRFDNAWKIVGITDIKTFYDFNGESK